MLNRFEARQRERIAAGLDPIAWASSERPDEKTYEYLMQMIDLWATLPRIQEPSDNESDE